MTKLKEKCIVMSKKDDVDVVCINYTKRKVCVTLTRKDHTHRNGPVK